MRRLGVAFGVEAMSLYNHVANKENLLNAMIDAVFEAIKLSPPSEDWKRALTRRSVSLRE
ncbi:MAG: putative transcriptional regulator [Cryobacterium sp.]|jgi:AcrR family transcriptional regulator|nr:putative transcriptional regulator [Cryobacterium sp.]